ncbi:MAG: class I SAM-dependent methyltransferase [Thermoplasmata archaeon]
MPENPFFKKFADEYSKSKSHKMGRDLIILDEMINNGANNCLDVATGTGFTALELSKKCKSVLAIDQTQSMINKAKDLIDSKGIHNVNFLTTDFENFESRLKYDIITIRRALHHFKYKDIFFKKCNEILNMNGNLIIVDMVSPENDFQDLFNKLETLRDKTHIGALKEKDYEDYFQKFGFKDIDKKIVVEDLSFSEWLYPIKENSEIASQCLNFLNNLGADDLKIIGYDKDNKIIHKSRIIVKAEKIKEI